MTNWINTSAGWKQVINIWINTASGWKEAISGFANTAAAGWQLFWGGLGQPQISVPGINRVAISISGTTDRTVDWIGSAPVLVGTNYNWTNYSSGTYEFQRAEAGPTLSWQTIGSPTNFNVNPTTSAQYTYTLQESDFPYGANTLFRFVVTVTNTAVTPNKTTVSYSTYSSSGTLTGYVTVNYPRPKGIPGSPTISRDADTNYTYNITGYGSYYNSVTITSNLVSWETSDNGTTVWTVRNTDNLPYPADTYKGKYLRLGVKGSNSSGQASDFIYSSTALIYYKPPTISSFTVSATTTGITYNYQYAADDPNKILLISYTGTSAGSFTPNLASGSYSLSPGTYNFVFKVQNSSDKGNSLYAESTVNNITISAITVPGAPTIGTVSRTSNTVVSVPFTAPSSNGGGTITSYNIISSPSISISTQSGTSSPLTATGSFAQGTSYTFQIAAVNSAGTGTYSASSNSVIPYAAAIIYPSPPTITSNSQTSSSITLNFTKGDNATSTRAYIGSSFDGATSGNTYTFSGLSSSTSYNLRLYGYDNTRESLTYSGGNYSTSAVPLTTYYITYIGNNNTSGFVPSDTAYTTASAGSVAGASSLARTNYTFNGWNTSANGAGTAYAVGDRYSTAGGLTLYAMWSATVTWNANGGSGGGSTTANDGVAHTAPSPGTRSGYSFTGYYNTSSGDYAYGPIASGGSFTPPGSITMNARWSSLAPSGGTASISGTAAPGSTLTLNKIDPNVGEAVTSTSITWQRNSGSSGAWVTAQNYGTSYVLGSSDLSYNMRVTVVWSNAYGSQTVTTNEIGPVVVAVADLTGLTVNSTTSGSFSISWNASTGAGSYAVVIGGPNGISTSTTATSYSRSGLISGSSYGITVTPYSGTSGNGTAGNGQTINKQPNGQDAASPFFPPFFPPFFAAPFFPFFPPFFPFFPPFFPFFPPFFPPYFTPASCTDGYIVLDGFICYVWYEPGTCNIIDTLCV